MSGWLESAPTTSPPSTAVAQSRSPTYSSQWTHPPRRAVLSRIGAWLRRERDDVTIVLPFEEVVAALGREGERALGLQTVPLGAVVGTVDRTRDFDRSFRPRSNRLRGRWKSIDEAQ